MTGEALFHQKNGNSKPITSNNKSIIPSFSNKNLDGISKSLAEMFVSLFKVTAITGVPEKKWENSFCLYFNLVSRIS